MTARIVGLFGVASLQGLPEPGYRRFGMPPGGAFDQEAHRLANAMLGNDPAALTLELGLATITLEFETEATVAITGAACEAPMNEPVRIRAGGMLTVPAPTKGARTYLALQGGWKGESAARKGSSFSSAGLTLKGHASWKLAPRIPELRFVATASPEIDGFTFRVSHRSDRVGVRLEGGPPCDPSDRLSEPTCFGTIQQTPDGTLIILGPDGPTIGGYAKIGTVVSADLDRLAQLRPGESVSLKAASMETAGALWRNRAEG